MYLLKYLQNIRNMKIRQYGGQHETCVKCGEEFDANGATANPICDRCVIKTPQLSFKNELGNIMAEKALLNIMKDFYCSNACIYAGEQHLMILSNQVVKCYGKYKNGQDFTIPEKYKDTTGATKIHMHNNTSLILYDNNMILCWNTNRQYIFNIKTDIGIRDIKVYTEYGSNILSIIVLRDDNTVMYAKEGSKDNIYPFIGAYGSLQLAKTITTALKRDKIRDIYVSSINAVLVTTKNRLSTWAHYEYYKDKKVYDTLKPLKLDDPSLIIEKVFAGDFYYVIALSDNTIRWWGDTISNERLRISQNQRLDSKIKKITGGNCHIMALTEKGTVYCWHLAPSDYCNNGQEVIPEIVKETQCADIAAVANMSSALLCDGRVISWGQTGIIPRAFSSITDEIYEYDG